jgi:hypothetical protein
VRLFDRDPDHRRHARQQGTIRVLCTGDHRVGDKVLNHLRGLADLYHDTLEASLRVGVDTETDRLVHATPSDIRLVDLALHHRSSLDQVLLAGQLDDRLTMIGPGTGAG